MYLCADVGGTKTLIATFTDEGELSKEVKFKTSQDYSQFLQDFSSNLKQLDEIDFKAASVAVPGQINRQEGIGQVFGNLPWKNVPVQSDIENIVKVPVILENDAKAGALSEALNVKDEFKRVAYITIGTGIGLGLVVNGVIDVSIGDLGGHDMILDYQGQHKSWEEMASGHAIVVQFGKKAEEITDEKSWQTIARNMSVGCINLIALTEPEVIIFGGGISVYFERFEKYLKDELKKYETPMMQIPPLRQANKPEEAVIYGCYELVKQKYGPITN